MYDGRRAQLSGSVEGRKITAEGFVFHYIIRAKLFPKSSDQKYQRYLYPVQGIEIGLGLFNPVDFLPACVPSKFNKRGG